MSLLAAIQNFFLTAQIIAIPEHRNEQFLKAMAGFAKKAKKLGVDAPTAKPFSASTMPMPKMMTVTQVADDGEEYTTYRPVETPCYVYLIDGLTPRITEEHEMCARVDFDPGTGIILVNTAPGMTIPAHYRTGTNKCDHCNKVRNRKAAYVLRKTATGEFLQVGGQCLLDYLGKSSVAALTFKYSMLEELVFGTRYSSMDDEMDVAWGSSLYTNTVSFVGCVLTVVYGDDGHYVSKGNERGLTSTASRAENLYFEFKKDKKSVPNKADAEAMIARAVAILNEKETLSDYEHNLKALLGTTIFRKGHGYVASIVPFVKRHEAEKVEKAAPKASEYVGVVGKRDVFKLTFVRTHSFEGAYGVSYIHRFKDQDGNVFVWKSGNDVYRLDASGDIERDDRGLYVEAVAGDTFEVKATVKAHDTFRDTKQTVITRASTLSMVQG